MDDYNRRVGAAMGRGAYRSAVEAAGILQRCRKKIADLLKAEDPERIVFTFNGTDSLNVALHGLLQSGDHVITSVLEHNSVVRPLSELRLKKGIEITRVGTDAAGKVDPAEFQRALRPQTKLIALIHASNVTGTVQPIADVGTIARKAGVLFLVDAAQTAGHLPIDISTLPVDMLACPGHKGLLGPLGTGVLYLGPGIEKRLTSHRQGGTGTHSEDDAQPETIPDKFESGNHNAPGLAGLEAGVSWLHERGIAEIHRHEQALVSKLLEGLSGIPGLRIYGSMLDDVRVGVVSLAVDGFDPHDVSAILDQTFGIETRAGLHCAAGVHRAMGSFQLGGTVRLSIGPFTILEDVAHAVDALQQIAGAT